MPSSFNVLFLCTANSARSILAEALMNHWSRGLFTAHSAGSKPAGQVQPWALTVLEQHGVATDGLRSKCWREFARAGAPHMDFIFAVCDLAMGEAVPTWPGHPITAAWHLADPAAARGSDMEKLWAFRDAYRLLERRVLYFLDCKFRDQPRSMLEKRAAAAGSLRAMF